MSGWKPGALVLLKTKEGELIISEVIDELRMPTQESLRVPPFFYQVHLIKKICVSPTMIFIWDYGYGVPFK